MNANQELAKQIISKLRTFQSLENWDEQKAEQEITELLKKGDNGWKILEYSRSEMRHEFGLMYSRFNILIACQSFLVVPLAILHGELDNNSYHTRILPLMLGICLFGILSTGFMYVAIRFAENATEPWLTNTIDYEDILLGSPKDFKRFRHNLSIWIPNTICVVIAVAWSLAFSLVQRNESPTQDTITLYTIIAIGVFIVLEFMIWIVKKSLIIKIWKWFSKIQWKRPSRA